MLLSRRAFLTMATIPSLALRAGAQRRNVSFDNNPFSLGVASGDPAPDGFVLWTRLAPEPLSGGGLDGDEIDVHWQVAADEGFQKVLRDGWAVADPRLAHSVHVEVDGLSPDSWYWYRFRAGNAESGTGRSRTLPASGSIPQHLRFAVASCQHYETGYYTAYKYMVDDSPDLIIHLGDYIYEGAAQPRVRSHHGGELKELEDYRNRLALYRTDADLQRAHAACPWLLTWDDHEFDSNYAATVSEEKGIDTDSFLARRVAAYQAYYEHMPLRAAQLPQGPNLQLYRKIDFGRLARFAVLDTRQYRSDQPCGDRTRTKPFCPGVVNPEATLLGEIQKSWLFETLNSSRSHWNVLAQQVMMARVDRVPGPDVSYSMDQWSGYDVPRRELLQYLQQSRTRNPVVLAGDIHSNWASDLKVDFDNPESPVVASEFVCTSISSGGDGEPGHEYAATVQRENPFVKLFNKQRGYISCELTPGLWKSHYRVLESVTSRNSPISTLATLLVEDGRPGVQQA